ncbi:MAG: hypothetical protein RL722_1281, partial [Pseudomonadota bacterium]
MSVQSFSLALPDASPALALPLLSRWLARAELQAAVATASALLVQVHVAAATPARSAWLFTHLAEALPQALCVGCSAEQGIAGGQPVRDAAVVSLLCLGHSRLRLEIAAGQPGAEYPLGMALGDRLAAPDLRGLLVLALPGPLDAGRLAEGAHGRLAAEVVVFGGVAAQPRIEVSAESNASAADPSAAASDLPGPGAAWINVDGRFHTGAVLAMVGFYGEALQMQQELLFAWKPIGPALTLDEVEGGFCVHRINAAPAAEVYQRLLRIEARNDEIYLLEFPLVVERRGVLLARNPVAMGEDGRVSFVATLRRGEQARLGYLDVDASVKAVDEARLRLQDFSPQALLLHSCVCRMHTLQQEIECETLPFQSLAEASGWYTHGEFGVQGGRVHLFNSTQSVVGLREGALPPASATIEASTAGARVAVPAPAPREPDPVRFRHAVITSRLLHSIGRLSEELEQANARLRHLSEHDALTGALNRRALEAQLQTELARSQRYGYALSLLMVDLDHFKRLNDSHGHTIGD